jgi:hypothetical protein
MRVGAQAEEIRMEREQEIAKLVNVLRRTSRMALQSEWTGSNQEVAAFCVEQYNRVLARLTEIDSSVGSVFGPLAKDSSLTVAAMACRQLAAYYEDEVGKTGGWGEWKGAWADPRFWLLVDKSEFKDFWQKSAREVEDFGEFIRERFDEFVKQYRSKQSSEGKAAPGPEEKKD